MMATIQRLWWVGLTGVLCIYYLAIGVTAGGSIAVAAVLGAVVMGSALALRSRSRPAANALLVLSALPLGILTWWSLVTPIVATLTLICGGLAIRTAGKNSDLRLHDFTRTRGRVGRTWPEGRV
jgi:hypothetical protein